MIAMAAPTRPGRQGAAASAAAKTSPRVLHQNASELIRYYTILRDDM